MRDWKQKWFTIRYKIAGLPHYYYRFVHRIRNFIRWTPIIWRDNDYDWGWLVAIIAAKANFMATHFEEHNHFIGCEDTANELRRLHELASRLEADEYIMAEKPADMEPREFYEACDKAQQDDLDEMCNLIKEKMFTWWD